MSTTSQCLKNKLEQISSSKGKKKKERKKLLFSGSHQLVDRLCLVTLVLYQPHGYTFYSLNILVLSLFTPILNTILLIGGLS